MADVAAAVCNENRASGRLVALACPADVAARRPANLEKDARHRGRPVSARQRETCRWTAPFGAVPGDWLTAGQWRVPHVQDPVLILPPFFPLFLGATGANRKFQVPFMMPAEVKNLPIHFQALAASPKSGNILSNRLTVTAK